MTVGRGWSSPLVSVPEGTGTNGEEGRSMSSIELNPDRQRTHIWKQPTELELICRKTRTRAELNKKLGSFTLYYAYSRRDCQEILHWVYDYAVFLDMKLKNSWGGAQPPPQAPPQLRSRHPLPKSHPLGSGQIVGERGGTVFPFRFYGGGTPFP